MAIDWNWQLIDQYDPPSDALLDEFEQRIGFPLPQQYRDFLKRHNGGSIKDCAELVADILTGYGWEGKVFDAVYAIDPEPDEEHDILEHQKYRGLSHNGERLLCIMEGGHSFLYLALSGDDAGAAWFMHSAEREPIRVGSSLEEVLPSFCIPSDDGGYAKDPIFHVVEIGDEAELRRYLAKGGDPNAVDEYGTPLISAAAIRQPYMVKDLIAYGADIELQNADGRSPLQCAASGSLDSLRLLLEAGADVHHVDGYGKNLLMSTGKMRAFKLLVSAGVDIHARSPEGVTVLGALRPRTELLARLGYDFTFDLEQLRVRIRALVENVDCHELKLICRKIRALGRFATPLVSDMEEFVSSMPPSYERELVEDELNAIAKDVESHRIH